MRRSVQIRKSPACSGQSAVWPLGRTARRSNDVCESHREWCQDWHGPYASGAVTDPLGPRAGDSRVYRGASWWRCMAGYFRSANRNGITPGIRNYNMALPPREDSAVLPLTGKPCDSPPSEACHRPRASRGHSSLADGSVETQDFASQTYPAYRASDTSTGWRHRACGREVRLAKAQGWDTQNLASLQEGANPQSQYKS
jgi:hypothetical protein